MDFLSAFLSIMMFFKSVLKTNSFVPPQHSSFRHHPLSPLHDEYPFQNTEKTTDHSETSLNTYITTNRNYPSTDVVSTTVQHTTEYETNLSTEKLPGYGSTNTMQDILLTEGMEQPTGDMEMDEPKSSVLPDAVHYIDPVSPDPASTVSSVDLTYAPFMAWLHYTEMLFQKLLLQQPEKAMILMEWKKVYLTPTFVQEFLAKKTITSSLPEWFTVHETGNIIEDDRRKKWLKEWKQVNFKKNDIAERTNSQEQMVREWEDRVVYGNRKEVIEATLLILEKEFGYRGSDTQFETLFKKISLP